MRPARFAELMIDSEKERERFDPTMVLLRSAPSRQVQKLLARGLEEDFISPLANRLGGPQWRTRTAMTLAILAGFETLRSVLRIDALNEPEARPSRPHHFEHDEQRRIFDSCSSSSL